MRTIVIVLLALACTRSSASVATTGDECIKKVLDAWLIADNGSVNHYLSDRFDVPVQDIEASSWPAFMRGLSPKERALAFGVSCTGRRLPCSGLSSCIRRASVTASGLYDVQRVRVTEEIAKDFPSVRDLVGQDVFQVAFVLRNCNVACYLIMQIDGRDERRVRSITYMAG